MPRHAGNLCQVTSRLSKFIPHRRSRLPAMMLHAGPLLGRRGRVSLKPLLFSPGRAYASGTHLAQLPRPGDKVNGFTVQRTKKFPELELTAVQLNHDRTGADYIHVARDDKNNVFSLGFKTNPIDSTGTPHILEHVTLCGSKKYPVRDPFFKMLNRSLSYVANVPALIISVPGNC